MWCPKCGKQLTENSTVCSYCGYQIAPQEQSKVVTPSSAKKSKKGVALIAVLVALVLILLSVLGVFVADKLNGNKENTTTTTQEITTSSTNEHIANNFKLIEDGVLTVAISGNFHPFAYIENDNVIGFDADIVTAIAKKLDLDVKFVVVEYSKLIQTVSAGNADIAINALVSNESHKSSVDLTNTYVSVEALSDGEFKLEEYVIAVRKSNGLLIAINNIIEQFKEDGTVAGLKAKYNIFEDYYTNYEDFENQPDFEDLDLVENGEFVGKSIHINTIGVLRFKANQKKQYAFLTNSKENENVCFLKYTFYIDTNENGEIDEGDELLYASDLICPGYAVKSFSLNRKLEQGEYNVIILEQAYSYDKQVVLLFEQAITTQIIVE